MASGRNRKRRPGPATAEQRQAAQRDYQLAVGRFQDSAYGNLRSAVANVAIFVGVFAVFALSIGEAGGPRLAPALMCVLAGLVGASYYLLRSRPKPAVYALTAAGVLVLVGVVWFIVAAQAG